MSDQGPALVAGGRGVLLTLGAEPSLRAARTFLPSLYGIVPRRAACKSNVNKSCYTSPVSSGNLLFSPFRDNRDNIVLKNRILLQCQLLFLYLSVFLLRFSM